MKMQISPSYKVAFAIFRSSKGKLFEPFKAAAADVHFARSDEESLLPAFYTVLVAEPNLLSLSL